MEAMMRQIIREWKQLKLIEKILFSILILGSSYISLIVAKGTVLDLAPNSIIVQVILCLIFVPLGIVGFIMFLSITYGLFMLFIELLQFFIDIIDELDKKIPEKNQWLYSASITLFLLIVVTIFFIIMKQFY